MLQKTPYSLGLILYLYNIPSLFWGRIRYLGSGIRGKTENLFHSRISFSAFFNYFEKAKIHFRVSRKGGRGFSQLMMTFKKAIGITFRYHYCIIWVLLDKIIWKRLFFWEKAENIASCSTSSNMIIKWVPKNIELKRWMIAYSVIKIMASIAQNNNNYNYYLLNLLNVFYWGLHIRLL